MARSRTHRRYVRKARSNPSSPRPNPPLFTDLFEFIGPGFAGFAATRFLSYVGATQVAKRKPSWGKHVGAVSAVGSFLAAWFLAHRVRSLEKYHTPIVVGSAIAAIQSLFQLYLPQVGWMLADPTTEIDQSHALQAQQAQQAQLQPANVDPNEYTFDERYDAGRFTPVTPPASSKISHGAQPPQMTDDDSIINDAIGSVADAWRN